MGQHAGLSTVVSIVRNHVREHGRTRTPRTRPPVAQKALYSARRMSQLSIDSLMSYHGGPLLKNGGAAVRKLVEKF